MGSVPLIPTNVILTSTGTGNGVWLLANVVPSTSTGTVRFYDPSLLCNVQLVNGQATCNASVLPGQYSFTATYSGDSTYSASTSPPIGTRIYMPLSSSANPSTFGQSVTFTIQLPLAISGLVSFYDGGTSIGVGVTSFTTSSLSVGTHGISAVFNSTSGGTTYTSAVITQVVTGN